METVSKNVVTALNNLLECDPVETAMEMKDLIFQATLLMGENGLLTYGGDGSSHSGNLYKLNEFFNEIIANR